MKFDESAKLRELFAESVCRHFARITAKPEEPQCAAIGPWEETRCIRRLAHGGMHVDEKRGWWDDRQAEEETERTVAMVHDS